MPSMRELFSISQENAEAGRILAQWQHNGKNKADLICKAIIAYHKTTQLEEAPEQPIQRTLFEELKFPRLNEDVEVDFRKLLETGQMSYPQLFKLYNILTSHVEKVRDLVAVSAVYIEK